MTFSSSTSRPTSGRSSSPMERDLLQGQVILPKCLLTQLEANQTASPFMVVGVFSICAPTCGSTTSMKTSGSSQSSCMTFPGGTTLTLCTLTLHIGSISYSEVQLEFSKKV